MAKVVRQSPPLAEKYIDTKTVAKIFGVTPFTVLQWVKEGKLPAYRFGKRLRFEARVMERLLREKVA
jgi:excisionase family DNA binding protein